MDAEGFSVLKAIKFVNMPPREEARRLLMPTSETSGWTAFLILATTVIGLFSAIWAINALCNLIADAKDALRSRYMQCGFSGLRWYDIAGVPAWLVLEMVCLVAAMLIALLICWVVYDTARSVRDWWHEGARRR